MGGEFKVMYFTSSNLQRDLPSGKYILTKPNPQSN